jgi:rhodanese-related sulfurtransferase
MIAWPAKIFSFPVAALLLGAVWQAWHPHGLWSLRASDAATEDGFPRVTWAEAGPPMAAGEWLLVDARDEEQFAAQHIPGAISLPAHAYPELLAFFAEDHGTDRPIVIYCGTEDCDLSIELALRLRDEAGCADVRILDGGFLAWRRTMR